MTIREPPNILDFDRRYSFTHIEWITSDAFENIVNNTEIHPNLTTIDQQKIYVGKALLENSDIEVIGAVSKNINGKWKLDIPYESSARKIEKNFLVLNIPDQKAFRWIATTCDTIPKYALRGSVEVAASEFLYIGRIIANDNIKPDGRFLDLSDMRWKNFNETVSAHFGKVHHSHKRLYAPINTREVAFSKDYEVLCLNPSPAPLKILSRIKVREILGHDDDRINKLKNYLPHNLFKFLQYPTYLFSGEYLLPNEKLISECGGHEIKITTDNCFIYINRATNEEYYTSDVTSLFLHFNQIVKSSHDAARFLKYDIDNDRLNPQEYKLKIISEGHNELYFQIEMLNEYQDVKTVSKIYLPKGWNHNFYLRNKKFRFDSDCYYLSDGSDEIGCF